MDNQTAQGLIDVVLNSTIDDFDPAHIKRLLANRVATIEGLSFDEKQRIFDHEWLHREHRESLIAMREPRKLWNIEGYNQMTDEAVERAIADIHLIDSLNLTADQVMPPTGNRKQRRANAKISRKHK